MVVYGTKTKQLATGMSPAKCTNCGTQLSVELHLFQKYFHVFWIPFIPIGKTAVSQCNNCKQILKLKEMPPALQEEYNNLKSGTKTPPWMFSGLALLVVLISVGIVTESKRGEKNAQLIVAPKIADVYEVKLKANAYTLYRVSRINGDSVWVKSSQFETNKISGLREIREKGEAGYNEEEIAYAKSELKKMLDQEEIRDIERK